MSFSVSQNLNLGIDRVTLQQVSQEILKRAGEKNSQYKTAENTTNFQVRDLGADLYSGKISTDLAKQIAVNNSGFQVQLSANAQAAINALNINAASRNVQKTVDGKLTIAVNEINIQAQDKGETPRFNGLLTIATDKDKNGSNPFYHGELLMANSKNDDKEKFEQ